MGRPPTCTAWARWCLRPIACPSRSAADGAVAMVHAGWRGLAAGVLEEGVRAVRELGGDGDLVAVIGPGAGPCCYEVGEEVHAAFGGQVIGTPPTRNPPSRRIDLKAIARDRLWRRE